MRPVIIALLITALIGCSTHDSARTDTISPGVRSPFDTHQVDTALQSDEPYSITVFSDSTANQPTEWVGILGQRIAAAYGRAVTLHNWSKKTNTYVSETVFDGDTSRPVTIWNGSASAKPVQYSIEHFATMMPGPSNLVIVSHGHNEPREALEGIRQLVDMSFQQGIEGVVIVLQNPRVKYRKAMRLQAATIKSIAAAFTPHPVGVAVVDVFSAFKQHQPVADLTMSDGLHPNEAGSQLWAETMAQSFGLASPP